jgi:alpha-tubulin suppressor-like RCC1 family protein
MLEEFENLRGEVTITWVCLKCYGKGKLAPRMPSLGRKVIQIIAKENILYALCDDGTIWKQNGSEWEPIKTPPKEEK